MLREYGSYARTYVDENAWIATVATRLRQGPDRRPTALTALHETWRSQGAAAALARYSELRRNHGAEYRDVDIALVPAGRALLSNGHARDAVTFFEGSLREGPNGPMNFYVNYQLAMAQRQLGNVDAARRACQRALELNPGFATATALLAELNRR